MLGPNMKTRVYQAEKLTASLNKQNYLSVNTEILQPQEIWHFFCKRNNTKKFTSYLYKTFYLVVPKVGSIKEVGGKQIIHFQDSSYILVIGAHGLNKKSLKDLSKFGRIHDLSADLVILRIKGRGSCELINRLVGIDAAEMEKGKNSIVPISCQMGSISKISNTVFELIIPSSYVTYFMSLIDTILLKLKSIDESGIKLDDLYSKLRNQ